MFFFYTTGGNPPEPPKPAYPDDEVTIHRGPLDDHHARLPIVECQGCHQHHRCFEVEQGRVIAEGKPLKWLCLACTMAMVRIANDRAHG